MKTKNLISFKLFPVLLGILLSGLLGSVHAKTYYVSNGGSDNNDGSSEQFAFRTITKANEKVQAGDQVLILPGTYEDAISPSSSGSEAGGYISYTGTGILPHEVIIKHAAEAYLAGVQIDHKSYIRVENLTVSSNARFGVWANASKENPVSHLQVINCVIEDNGYRVAGWGSTGIRTKYMDDMLIRNCTIRNNYGGGILLLDAVGVIIENCQVIGNRAGMPYTYSADDFDGVCIQSCSDVLIRNVEAAYNGEDGIDIGLHEEAEHIRDNSNVYIEACVAHHNAKKGICVSNSNELEDGWRIHDVTITRCLSFYNGKAGIELYQNSTDLRLSHNTVISQSFGNDDNDSQYDCGINIEVEGVDRVYLRNNISAFHESLNFSAKKAANAASVVGYSNLWNHSLNNTLNYTSNQDVIGDPRFTNKGSITAYPDLNLQAGSPAIDKAYALATCTNAGSGSTALELDDALWFTDGLGILEGSTIRIGDQTAVLTEITDANNIVLDRAMTWSIGDGITYDFLGNAPDIGAIEFGELDHYMDDLSIIPSLPPGYNPDTWPQSAPEPDMENINPDPNADAGTVPANNSFEAGLRYYNNSSCEMTLVKKKGEDIGNVFDGNFAVKVSKRSGATGSPKQDDGYSTNLKEYFKKADKNLYRAGVWIKPDQDAYGITAGVTFELKKLNESMVEEKSWSSYPYAPLSGNEWTECWGIYSIPDDEALTFAKIWAETKGESDSYMDYFIDNYYLRVASDQDVVDLISRDLLYEMERANGDINFDTLSENIDLPVSAEYFRCKLADATLAWSSSRPEYLSVEGVVSYMDDKIIPLTLEVVISYGDASAIMAFPVKVTDPSGGKEYVDPDPTADEGTVPANKSFEAGKKKYNESGCLLNVIYQSGENFDNVHSGSYALKVFERSSGAGSPKQDDGYSTNMKDYFHSTDANVYRAGAWVKPVEKVEGVTAGVTFEFKKLNESMEEEKFWSSYNYTALSESEWTDCWGVYSIADDDVITFAKLWMETKGDGDAYIDYYIDDYYIQPASDQDVVDLILRDIDYELGRVNDNFSFDSVYQDLDLPGTAEYFKCGLADASLSWVSGNGDVLGDDGAVNVVDNKKLSVNLTLTVSYGTASGVKEFSLRVIDPNGNFSVPANKGFESGTEFYNNSGCSLEVIQKFDQAEDVHSGEQSLKVTERSNATGSPKQDDGLSTAIRDYFLEADANLYRAGVWIKADGEVEGLSAGPTFEFKKLNESLEEEKFWSSYNYAPITGGEWTECWGIYQISDDDVITFAKLWAETKGDDGAWIDYFIDDYYIQPASDQDVVDLIIRDIEYELGRINENLDLKNVSADLDLPSTAEYFRSKLSDATLNWTSSNQDVLSNDGQVSVLEGKVVVVDLELSISFGSATGSILFSVNVKDEGASLEVPQNNSFEEGSSYFNPSSCILTVVDDPQNVHSGSKALLVSNRDNTIGSPKQDDGFSTNMKDYFHATDANFYRAGVWIKPLEKVDGIYAGVTFEMKKLNEAREEEKFWSSYRYAPLSEAEWTECWGVYTIPEDDEITFAKIWTESYGDESDLIDYYIDDYYIRPAVDQDVVDLIARDIFYELSRINEGVAFNLLSGDISLPRTAGDFRCKQAEAFLSWSSSNADILSDAGLVNFVAGETVDVTLTMAIDFAGLSKAVDLVFTISDPLLSVSQADADALKIYPNPSKEHFRISGFNGTSQVSILDMGGRIVKHFDNVQADQELTVGGLESGFYLLRITCNDTVELRSLTIL